MSDPDFNICRKCHNIYSDLSQEFCADGCHKQPPYIIDGMPNPDIEPRLIPLHKNSDETVHWLCLNCLLVAEEKELKQTGYICPNESCNSENKFYPFTSKRCANCTVDNNNRELPIWALACEKCGEKDFILNGNTPVRALKRNLSNVWDGPDEIILPKKEIGALNTNQISLNLQVLNNNFEITLYGEGKQISFQDVIQNARGFVPESIYLDYLTRLALGDPIFEIHFNPERELFSFSSILKFTKIPLTPRFEINGEIEIWEPGSMSEIPEGKLLQLEEDFFKIQLWVY